MVTGNCITTRTMIKPHAYKIFRHLKQLPHNKALYVDGVYSLLAAFPALHVC